MIPYDYSRTYVCWFDAWRHNIRQAKSDPDTMDGYCRAAMIAQMEYVCALAIYVRGRFV